MTKVAVSAPGKLLLFGEHAVVYNRPCIVTSVDQKIFATLEHISEPTFELDAGDVDVVGYKKSITELSLGNIPNGAKFAEMAVKNFFQKYPFKNGIKISTKSEFSSKYGFGSSSASTVCIIKGLSELTNNKLTNKDVFDLAYKTVLDIQGKGSGFDVASAIWGGTLYFVTGGKIIEPLNILDIPIIVGYSGSKADTSKIVKEVAQKKDRYPEKVERIFGAIADIVEKAKISLLSADWQRTGTLMNFNQDYLRNLGASTDKLESMISGALTAGAYGAKLSGAGGGDCIIALASRDKREGVIKAIASSGGQVIDITTDIPGVKVL
jgi:mevalonate kinase